MVVGNDGSVGLCEKPVVLCLDGLPPFTTTLANTAAVVTTNCVKSQKNYSFFPTGTSAYFTLSIKANDPGWTSRGNVRLRTDRPWLWIIGDQSVPEILEGTESGRVVGVTRVEDASFGTLRTLLKATLPTNKPRCGLFPVGSVILVSAPVELLRVDVSAFLALYNDFEKWLCARLRHAEDPDNFIFKEGEVELSEYVVLPIFPPTNDENLLHRIAAVNHNTMVKLAKFPAPQTQLVAYQRLLGYPKTAERRGMQTRALELGSLPVLAPNFSSSKGIAISSVFTAQIPTAAPYILDSQQRSPQYFPHLLDILTELRPELNIPSGKELNQGDTPMMKPASKRRGKGEAPKVTTPKVVAPLGGLTETGRIFVIGQSTAGKLVMYMKDVLHVKGVVHQLSAAPLTDQKVTRLIGFLEDAGLGENDTVILDLTCNFAPNPPISNAVRIPWSTGKVKSKKFHLADSKGGRLVVPSTAVVDGLLRRIVRVTESITTKGVLVINLSPLPRFQGACCAVTTHGLQAGEDQGTLNSLFRDIGVYMGRMRSLHRPDHSDFVVSPMDCAGPSVFSQLRTCKDNVHPSREFLSLLALTLLSIRKQNRCASLPGPKGLLPPGLSFSLFSGSEQNRRVTGRSIPDDRYRPTILRGISHAPIPFV